MASNQQNVGAELLSKAVGAATAVAAGAGDNTEVTGQTIDRKGYRSGVLSVCYVLSLTAAKTFSLGVKIQESADGSNWDTAEVLLAPTVLVTGASTATGVYELDQDLSARKRYVRYNITPDLSHTSTDTVSLGAVFTMGGAAVLPAV